MRTGWVAVFGTPAGFELVRIGGDRPGPETFTHFAGNFAVERGALTICCEPTATPEDAATCMTAARLLCDRMEQRPQADGDWLQDLYNLPDTRPEKERL